MPVDGRQAAISDRIELKHPTGCEGIAGRAADEQSEPEHRLAGVSCGADQLMVKIGNVGLNY